MKKLMILKQKEDLKNQEETSESMTVTVRGITVKQHKHEYYAMKIRSKELFENANLQVDTWALKKINQGSKQGYQRELQDKHAKEFTTFINNPMNFSPTSAYVNIRPENKSKCTIKKYDKDTVDITFKKDVILNIVDGQHRLIGMRDEMDWTLDPEIEILLTLTYGLTKNEEIEQFITMNRLQSSVKTDLAEMAITDIVSNDEAYLTQLATKGNVIFKDLRYLKTAIAVMRSMYKDSDSIWYKRILMPNQSKQKGGITGVSTKSFTESLRDLVQEHSENTKKNVEQSPLASSNYKVVANHLTDFWEGLSLVNKEMFKEQNVCRFAIQQTIGTMVMHKVLFKIYRNCQSRDVILNLGKLKWKALLDVSKLTSSNMWDREYDDKAYRKEKELPPRQPGEKPTGGYFTRQGTNQKSFGLMADEIFAQITRNPEWKNYKLMR